MSSSHVHPVARRAARQAGADRVERGAGKRQHILVFEMEGKKSLKIPDMMLSIASGGVTAYPEQGVLYQYIYVDPVWEATVFWNSWKKREECLWEPRGEA